MQTATARNNAYNGYTAPATHGALYSTAPGGTAGTELTGGSPAYARIPLVWSAPTNGVGTAPATFNVASGSTVAGGGLHTAITAGTYLDGASVTSQAFSSQGTYQATFQATFT